MRVSLLVPLIAGMFIVAAPYRDGRAGIIRHDQDAAKYRALGENKACESVGEVTFDIPARGFQRISTAGTATSSDVPFVLNGGASLRTPGSGSSQVSGWEAADLSDPEARLTGLQIIETTRKCES